MTETDVSEVGAKMAFQSLIGIFVNCNYLDDKGGYGYLGFNPS
ncbi:hypothetical protein M595_0453 [Lyngbya aestuarii BL J]|uniref:Uncharacterized protein n=1 Tax=Lyngbya aestuarii BL J TaxID=1348334 RepID=U7QST6_9CYAN|nr:hypothetical protein M595_0453 [Lyngbya aestuarii BL J]